MQLFHWWVKEGGVLPSVKIPHHEYHACFCVLFQNKLGEPTLQYLGLGSAWTPVGWIQRLLEFLHVSFDVPWWGSIAICEYLVWEFSGNRAHQESVNVFVVAGVIGFRLILFPLVIKSQKAAAKMRNVMPEMTKYQDELQTAKLYGNQMEGISERVIREDEFQRGLVTF